MPQATFAIYFISIYALYKPIDTLENFTSQIQQQKSISFNNILQSKSNTNLFNKILQSNPIITEIEMEDGGTEAFADLGRHCQHSDCHQLDFLPFKCYACHQFFCLDHRSCKSHDCPKSGLNDRKVVVCEICSTSIETTGFNGMDEKSILEKHQHSGDCDPRKAKKPKCPVRRCREILTFSNSTSCQHCHVKVCLKHRFPADHACKRQLSSPSFPALTSAVKRDNKFLVALASRNGKDCGSKSRGSNSPPHTPSVKAH